MAQVIEPEQAMIDLLVTGWDYDVWLAHLEEDVNIFHFDKYEAATPPEKEDYILVWVPGPSRRENWGTWSHHTGWDPVAVEIHSRRSHDDELAHAGLREVLRILGYYRTSIGTVVPGYRKIHLLDEGEPIHSRQVYKWLTKCELQESLEAY